MAKFETAYKITAEYEGGYADNKNDLGGITYAGISRRYWPKWAGWPIVDQIKAKVGIKGLNASKDAALHAHILDFYRVNFWNRLKLDYIVDQQLADTVYDFAVNAGVSRAAITLQKSANELGNFNLSVDGIIGPKTIGAVNSLNPKKLHDLYQAKRRAYYNSIGTGSQAQFLKGWLKRVKDYKDGCTD